MAVSSLPGCSPRVPAVGTSRASSTPSARTTIRRALVSRHRRKSARPVGAQRPCPFRTRRTRSSRRWGSWVRWASWPASRSDAGLAVSAGTLWLASRADASDAGLVVSAGRVDKCAIHPLAHAALGCPAALLPITPRPLRVA